MTRIETISPRNSASLKWFMFDQNNSGGYFIKNDVVCEHVGIQARDAEEAIRIARYLFDPYSGYCECCGERWSYYMNDEDGTDVPSIYGDSIYETKKSWFRGEVILHYANGCVERVFLQESE